MFTLKEFLKEEVKPALGCTEPVAVALAVARAKKEISTNQELNKLVVEVSDSIYKNGMDVGIPGTNGAKGNTIAAGLGLICGNPNYGLEVLSDCTEEDVSKAKKMIENNKIHIKCHTQKTGVYVNAKIFVNDEEFSCIIEHDHSNITMVSKNGEVLYGQISRDDSNDIESIASQIGNLTYKEVLDLVEEMDENDVDYIMNGVNMNLEIAKYGLKKGSVSGASFGKTFKNLINNSDLKFDIGYLIKIYSYAASDARMSGAQMPVMSSAGSGNHGITAIIPIAVVGKQENKTDKEIAKAITISHLTTSYVKSNIGRLSPVCGCAVAAGVGSSAGLTYLLNGNYSQMVLSIQTLLSNISGMICDGAKASCALKVGTAAFESYLSALFAINNTGISSSQGIIDDSIEKTMDNVGKINGLGMKNMDSVIIDIMEHRKKKKDSSKKNKSIASISYL